jgi:membrane protease YdiL (CAAX protease family)
LILFFLLAYAWAWSFWLLVLRNPLQLKEGSTGEVIGLSLFLVGACGPSVAALVTQWFAYRNLKICHIWTGWKPFLIGGVVGVSCFFIATVIGPALLLVRAPVKELNWSALAHWTTYAVNYSTFLGGPINEEPGWRGFALPRLQQRFGPYLATLILGLLWAGWHLPAFYFQGWATVSRWQFLLIVVGISFLMTAAANISRFNILVAILLHAFFNTSSGLVNAFTHGLPLRSYQQTSYALTALVCGVVLGAMALRLRRASPSEIEQVSDDAIGTAKLFVQRTASRV